MQRLQSRKVDRYFVVWLDSNIGDLNEDTQYSIQQLHKVTDALRTFTELEDCMEFIKDTATEKIFLIISGSLGYRFLPRIEHTSQIHSIYVFCQEVASHLLWTHKYKKIKGVFDDVNRICEQLKRDIAYCERAPLQISTKSNMSAMATNALDASFMYSQLLRETLLELEYGSAAKTDLVEHCRRAYADNERQLDIISEFENTYTPTSAVRWYTRDCFLHTVLNRALRTQNIEVIMKLGFFIRDLHEQIKQLHLQSTDSASFSVHRGQEISKIDLESLRQHTGCLMSFNHFLSTSKREDVAKRYARQYRTNSDTTAVIFRMEIDPSVSSTPYAALDNSSYYEHNEKEVLFSTHTVFRIGDVALTDDGFQQITLTLTNDNDRCLAHLAEHLRSEMSTCTGLHRMGALLIRMGEFDRAENIFSLILKRTSPDKNADLAALHHQLGCVNDERGDLAAAYEHYHLSIFNQMHYLSAEHPQLANNYSKLGLILKKQGKLDDALANFEYALYLDRDATDSDQLQIAARHSNTALVQHELGRHTEALKSYQSALDIFLICLLPEHPDIANTYNSIGRVYESTDDKATALSYYEKALGIEQRCLPANHPTLAITHHHIAVILEHFHQYDSAIQHAQDAVEIARHTFGERTAQMQQYRKHLNQLLAQS